LGFVNIESYRDRMMQALAELGVPADYATQCKLPPQIECEDLVSIGLDMFQREQRLERGTALQWQSMVAAAIGDEVALAAISGFRSFDYQKGIIQRKLASGLQIDEILRVSALPGFSEHHTGRAIDIGTAGFPALTEEFETTPAFEWLTNNAAKFGFSMSYPRKNPLGIIYEPWHWCRQ